MAAWWARAGIPVLMVDIEARHVAACRSTGLQIEGPVDAFTQVIPSVTPEEFAAMSPRTYSQVVLAVKALATDAAVEAIEPHLAADGVVLSAQNGLNEVAIARRIGEARTLGCFVNFAADWLAPGRILFGSRGTLVLGELDGAVHGRTRRMHELLKVFEPNAELSTNIWGNLWGKLGYLSMVYATALNNDSMLANFENPDRRATFVALGREAVAVARAHGVTPVGFAGFEPSAFMPGASDADARESMAALCDYRHKSAKTHSGIWRDLSVRKRRTEVDSQIGLMARMGSEAGVATPMLHALTQLIHDIEEDRRTQSSETFQALASTCPPPTTSTAA
ncbi:ketopantoate reductase family protein [Verticiella sediminum]|uniref:2-dehydropantoate 2-reductase n=2 Tax=Verticiella sediminum TaxID=1247510 RepID=A0A556AEE5_9BURK|nr:ketopantoate reductase family protein [Verticiella sediminum]